MAIIHIPNQPVDLQPTAVDDCNVGDGKEYCILYNTGEKIYWQGKQTPCGVDLNCAPTFGVNLVKNGTFNTSLEFWSTFGRGTWVWLGGKLFHPVSGSATSIVQTIAMMPTKSYVVTFTVSGYVSGSVRVTLGGTNGTTRSANGTYVETIVAGSLNSWLTIQPTTTDFSGSIEIGRAHV